MRVPAATLRVVPRIALSAPRLALRLSPRGRRRLLLAALISAVLGTSYFAWFRDSSLVRVERVTVGGLDTPDAGRIRGELAAAAARMTTLHVDDGALRAAVRDEPLVRALSVDSGFPHTLRIHVVENRPVALLTAGHARIAVAPDGTLLTGARIDFSLPAIHVGELPQGARLGSPSIERLVAVAGAAPMPLLLKVDSVARVPAHGLVARLHDGPEIWFGGASALAEKWRAAAVVLAQRSSRGASYVDVRMPTRPLAGGLPVTNDPQPLAQQDAAGAPAVIAADPGQAPAAGAQTTQPAAPAAATRLPTSPKP